MTRTDWSLLCGYTDQLSARPGETVTIMVHSNLDSFETEIVRLGGPSRGMSRVTSLGKTPGRHQRLTPGSYIRLRNEPWPRGTRLDDLRIEALVYPTSTDRRQCIWSTWDPSSDAGCSLELDASARLRFAVSGQTGSTVVATCGSALLRKEWYRVWGEYNNATKTVSVGLSRLQRPDYVDLGDGEEHARCQGDSALELLAGRTLIAARDDPHGVSDFFTGRIEGPRLSIGAPRARQPIADWDFSADIATINVTDRSGNGWHGETVNQPARAVTGARWSGEEHDWRTSPHAYGAIHFHPDDLDDAGWEPSGAVTIPDEWTPGVFGIALRGDGVEDVVPIWIRPPLGTRAADVCVLFPTMTYLAYSNEQGTKFKPLAHSDIDDFLHKNHHLRSLYDRHEDGFGVSYASLRRPLSQFRPHYLSRYVGAPHGLNLDLRLLGFLAATGIDCDVITDHDLDKEGVNALSGYRVLLTGGHPEYMTRAVIDAIHGYVSAGGNLMYLGGNGFHGVVATTADSPHVLEIRRAESNGFGWQSPPGEHHHSLTGEFGGHWRRHNLPEHRFLGVGFTAVGNGHGRPYARVANQEELDWVFADVESPHNIGDYGDVLGAAASYEIDRADHALGTPTETIVLATASGFGSDYTAYVDDVDLDASYAAPGLEGGGLQNAGDRVRADMTLIDRSGRGSIFSVGSIGWCGSLEHNRYANDVARITRNVLHRFLADSAGTART